MDSPDHPANGEALTMAALRSAHDHWRDGYYAFARQVHGLTADRDRLRVEMENLKAERDSALMSAGAHESIAEGRATMLDRAHAERDRLRAEVAKLNQDIGEHQDAVRDYLLEACREMGADGDIDGGGCDSGDWRDFTMSELEQGIGIIMDWHDGMLAAGRTPTDQAKADAAWLRVVAKFLEDQRLPMSPKLRAIADRLDGNGAPPVVAGPGLVLEKSPAGALVAEPDHAAAIAAKDEEVARLRAALSEMLESYEVTMAALPPSSVARGVVIGAFVVTRTTEHARAALETQP